MWFVELTPQKVGQITPAGVITEFALGDDVHPHGGIALGPDGRLWFTGKFDTDPDPAEDAWIPAISAP